MDKTIKNVLAAVGAIAVVKAAPVLAAGVAIGAVVANPDKAKKAVEDFVGRVEEEVAKLVEEEENQNGEACTCEGKCACDEESNQATEEVHIPCEELAPDFWDEELTEEEESPVKEEPEPEMSSAKGNFEEARAQINNLLDKAFEVLENLK